MNMRYTLVLVLLSFSLGACAQDIPKIDWESLQETKPWEATEVWEPVPPVVEAKPGIPPGDATVLFDGSGLSSWQKPQFDFEGANMDQIKAILKNLDTGYKGDAADWVVEKGELVVKPGSGPIETTMAFGDMQLHVEWMSPVDRGKEGQAYSNSGIFLMSFYELQVLNNYKNTTYPNGQAGSIYKQHMPLVNASRPPGEWQVYDIIFQAPRFNETGELITPARVTVLHNGVLVQNNVALKGPTAYIGKPEYIAHPKKLPLRLQDHGDPVRFRNIWVREL